MKALVATLCLVFSFQAVAQNSTEEFRGFVDSKEKARRELWDKKKYDQAIVVMKNAYAGYLRQDSLIRQSYVGFAHNLFYNLSCAYSLTNQKDSALTYLRAALNYGYSNYTGTLKDTDFDNIRNDHGFQEVLAQMREVGDFEHVLRKYPGYESGKSATPTFTYEPAHELRGFREKYNLDSVAGRGNEVSKIINLMRWVHSVVRHDGNSPNPSDKTAAALINICKEENRGVNCRMMATIMNEACLAEGFPSRFVTCMPRGEQFDDCHVINVVYSKELEKWIWMDPTFETFVADDKGHLLGIDEVREKLIRGERMVVAPSLNWNGKPYDGGANQYLHVYMAKNLFRFSCPLQSASGFESRQGRRAYVELYPLGYNPSNVVIGAQKDSPNGSSFFTTNAKEFWAKPTGF